MDLPEHLILVELEIIHQLAIPDEKIVTQLDNELGDIGWRSAVR